jgi:hypothetical protein
MMKLDAYLAAITVAAIAVHVAAWIWSAGRRERRRPGDPTRGRGVGSVVVVPVEVVGLIRAVPDPPRHGQPVDAVRQRAQEVAREAGERPRDVRDLLVEDATDAASCRGGPDLPDRELVLVATFGRAAG